MENISQVIKFIHDDQPHSQYTAEFHKPMNAYLNHVAKAEDAPITKLFEDIEILYTVFTKTYKPFTSRNYIRLLKQTFDIVANKVYDKETCDKISATFDNIIKKADHEANVFQKKAKKQVVVTGDAVGSDKSMEQPVPSIQSESQCTESEIDFHQLNVEEITSVHTRDKVFMPKTNNNVNEIEELKTKLHELQLKCEHYETKCHMYEANVTYHQLLVQQLLQIVSQKHT